MMSLAMKNHGSFALDARADLQAGLWMPRPASGSDILHWVTPQDLQELKEMLQRGWLPLDFEAKLLELAGGGLADRQIERNCRLFVALLTAAYDGAFRGVTRAECDRLLTVLAYVRKTDDAIPDYRDDGFVDDHQEVHTATVELASLLQAFKAWRLRHQVPGMWGAENEAGRGAAEPQRRQFTA
jgi:hypothetical protein